jgi:hypothetical protein
MNNNQNSKYLLFYSNRCNHCKEFLSKLTKTNLKDSFSFFCIDNNYQNIPKGIKSVPTLLFKEDNNIIVGKTIFGWLNDQISPKKQSENPDDPLAWHGAEMGGAYSDNYSFLDSDTSAEGTGGSSIAHSFSFLSDGTPQIGSENNNVESSQESQKDRLTQNMENMMSQRDSEIQAPVQRF